jgi:DNA-directed RNA polymerase subunit beta
VKAYEAIVKGENIAEPSIPESFKVLLKEMQSLALDVNVVSEEGQRAEMRDEDDDLLRAAEELGIDLSGVRAGDGAAVDGEGPVAADEAVEEKDADVAETEEVSEETGEAPDNLEDVDLEADIDIGDIEIPEDDTEQPEGAEA